MSEQAVVPAPGSREAKRQKRRGVGQSDERLAYAVGLRTRKPPDVLPERLAKGQEVVVKPAEFTRIDIDERYQRLQIKDLVGDIVVALRSGGRIAAAVHLASRKWGPDADRKRLWILDGQQRFWAASEVGHPLRAVVHETHSLDDERLMFKILNARVQVNSNSVVHAAPGAAAAKIRAVSEDPTHPLYGRIQTRSTGDSSKLGAGLLAAGCFAAVSGRKYSAPVREYLSAVDAALAADARKGNILAGYLNLIGTVCPTGSLPKLAVLAYGHAAHMRWEADGLPKMPSPKEVYNLRRINWKGELPNRQAKFLLIAVGLVDARWKS